MANKKTKVEREELNQKLKHIDWDIEVLNIKIKGLTDIWIKLHEEKVDILDKMDKLSND